MSATRSKPRSRRRLLLALAFAAVVAVELVFVVRTLSDRGESPVAVGSGDAQACPATPLAVSAAPALAPAVERAAERIPGACGVTVTPAEPADVLAALADPGLARPDVWVPDSSLWLQRAAADGLVDADEAPSVATTPVVLALTETDAEQVSGPDGRPDLARLLAAQAGPDPLRLALADPDTSAPTVGALLALQQVVAERPDARPLLVATLRAASSQPDGPGTLDTTAVQVTTEQSVVRHNETAAPEETLRPMYLPAAAQVADHPWAVLSDDAEANAAAQALFAALSDQQGRAILDELGFRSAEGLPGPTTNAQPGVVAGVPVLSTLPDADTIEAATEVLDVLRRPSRLLAVIDVSGSMAARVPGTQTRRMDLARDAAGEAISLFGDDSDAGLWVFSTELGPEGDHRELVELGPVGERDGEPTGREQVRAAIPEIQYIPDGDTGLYDTVLAAVREVREDWDPDKSNLVAVLTDGRNDDADGISLDQLLATLREEADPARPVPVLGIAYGPDSDTDALEQIGQVTGGALYVSRDPRDIRQVFLDAVGARLCRPTC